MNILNIVYDILFKRIDHNEYELDRYDDEYIFIL